MKILQEEKYFFRDMECGGGRRRQVKDSKGSSPLVKLILWPELERLFGANKLRDCRPAKQFSSHSSLELSATCWCRWWFVGCFVFWQSTPRKLNNKKSLPITYRLICMHHLLMRHRVHREKSRSRSHRIILRSHYHTWKFDTRKCVVSRRANWISGWNMLNPRHISEMLFSPIFTASFRSISGHKQRALVCKLFYLNYSSRLSGGRTQRREGWLHVVRKKLKTMKRLTHSRKRLMMEATLWSVVMERRKVLRQSSQSF